METNRRLDEVTPVAATHPTDIIKAELKARGMSKAEFARKMDMQASNVTRLFKTKAAITVQMANRLETVLGIDAAFWLRMQALYEKDIQKIKLRDEEESRASEQSAVLSDIFNMKELCKRLGISTTRISERLRDLQSALMVDLSDIASFQFCLHGNFKKSDKLAVDEKNQRTWLLLAHHNAKVNKPDGQYEKGNARLAAAEISQRVHMGGIREHDIKDILSKWGISYSVVPKLEKTPIDAFSAWIVSYPAIVTTHRYDDMSRLVFNVIHELGHIELHLSEDDGISYISTDGIYSCSDPKELEANRFAEEMIISDAVWKRMMNATCRGILGKDIVSLLEKLSEENGLDPHMVLWRYKHETQVYAIRGIHTVPIS